MRNKILKLLGMIFIALVVLVAGGIYWANSTETKCWQSEAAHAFEHYQELNTHYAILREAESTGRDITNSKSGSLEIIEKEPNGCGLGSNGRTVVRLYFDNAGKLSIKTNQLGVVLSSWEIF